MVFSQLLPFCSVVCVFQNLMRFYFLNRMKTVIELNSLTGFFSGNYRFRFFVVDWVVTFAQFFAFVLHVSTCLTPGGERRPQRRLLSSSWRTTRSWRSREQIGSRCSIGTAMRVTLWALMRAGGNCHEHMQDAQSHYFAVLGFHLQEVFAMDRVVSKRSSAHVLRSFAISYCFLAVILDQKSLAAVRWLPPHCGRRSVEASLVVLSLKTHLSVATSSLCVISKHKSTTGVCQLRCRRRRCSEASFVVFSHKTHFSVAMNSFL